MSYLDDLSAIFGQSADGSADAVDVPAEVTGETPVETARRQLADGKTGYCEGPEGTFHGCGSRFGCGYAEATVTVDPATGLADVDIDSNLRISPDNVKAARKLFRRLNQTFIIPGLVVEDGTMHFHPEEPCDLSEDDVSEYLGKGFSTIHAHAHMVAQLEAGRSPWKVLHSNDRDDDGDDEPGGMLEALRRMIS